MHHMKILLLFTNIWLFTYINFAHVITHSLAHPAKAFPVGQLNKYDPYKYNNTKRHFKTIFMVGVVFFFFVFSETLSAFNQTKCSFFFVGNHQKVVFAECQLVTYIFSVRHILFCSGWHHYCCCCCKQNFVHPPNDKYSEI